MDALSGCAVQMTIGNEQLTIINRIDMCFIGNIIRFKQSLPLYCGWRFGTDIINYPVDSFHFIYDVI